jgi:hypothetical protein
MYTNTMDQIGNDERDLQKIQEENKDTERSFD